ncbi:hypothetical protein [Mariniflexile sp. HMF6888]|uniref:hypothetical protein n=1 Tax=Mariniflexile sp. HMF6888 TaxID=3373086 RepID=UPI00379B0FDF
MYRILKIVALLALVIACRKPIIEGEQTPWQISALPNSVRLNPVTNEIIEYQYQADKSNQEPRKNLLERNWIFDGDTVRLKGARGEYISFQLVISNRQDTELTGLKVEMSPFIRNNIPLNVPPELFLEWSLAIKTTSTGYPKATLGTGWYPDALIPLKYIQQDSTEVRGRWVYPFTLPDFNNRIEGQKSQIVWVDQYIPFEKEKAEPGTYTTEVTVTIDGVGQQIPVKIDVWDFAIPKANHFKASLQQEGFLSGLDEEQELAIYQLFKRNRISLMDPTYSPALKVDKNGTTHVVWDDFDARLKKYLTGEAFTEAMGYKFGPGYGEPTETFVLPFDVYGKHGTKGWPNIGKPDVERNPKNIALYKKVIKEVHDHLVPIVDLNKTDLIVYLNGLDESYFPEAWDRMVYFGKIFKDMYPEAQFRVDGAYNEEAMAVIRNSISAWAVHTINYNHGEVKKYRDLGIKDWLYGPLLYESKVNSWVGSTTFIDLPLVNDRAISWSCWKYNTYSWLSWGIGAGWENGWYDPESWKDFYKEASEADAEFSYRKFNGNGSLIYKPGIVPNISEACPSIRLKTMRNGVQEYEYLRLLTKLDGNSDRADALVNKLVNEPFGDHAIGNLKVWSFDPQLWDEQRLHLGDMIHQLVKNKK